MHDPNWFKELSPPVQCQGCVVHINQDYGIKQWDEKCNVKAVMDLGKRVCTDNCLVSKKRDMYREGVSDLRFTVLGLSNECGPVIAACNK